jgi:alpha-galactosidase
MKMNMPATRLFTSNASIRLALIVTAGTLLAGLPARAQTITNPPAVAATAPPLEEAVILTPLPSPQPRINGTAVFGVRPGSPFIFTVAATGDRPMIFSEKGLPSGLKLNAKTGRITGILKKEGEYSVTLQAKNKLGTAQREFRIICGPLIGLTPALGWNSWNCFGGAVTEAKVKSAADAMVATNAYGRLIDHGWTYINTDDFWEVNPRNAARGDATLAGDPRDSHGRIRSNPRFPDMKKLVNHIHDLGLKAGLYSSPGPTTCGGCIGSWDHEELDAKQYADWGFDYLKYDWCSYGDIANQEAAARLGTNAVAQNPNGTNAPVRQGRRNRIPLTVADYQKPYRVMHDALAKQSRDIIFSLCQYGMGNVWEWGADVGGNSWRTTGDIRDNWRSLSSNGFRLGGHEKFVGPGHFDDPDMLVVGAVDVGSGRNLRASRLTPNEQYTHISLWCLLTSPLLIGCDMTRLDEFTLNLLCNDEVLEVDQDPLCRQASRVVQDTDKQIEIWTKPMKDGSETIGLFNRSDSETQMIAKWSDLGLTGNQKVRDLWRQKDLGNFTDQFETSVPRHGVVLVRVWPVK